MRKGTVRCKSLSYSNRTMMQPDGARSPRRSLGLWTPVSVRLWEAHHNLHRPQTPSIHLWQPEFQASRKNRKMGVETSTISDHSQVSERRSKPRRLPVEASERLRLSRRQQAPRGEMSLCRHCRVSPPRKSEVRAYRECIWQPHFTQNPHSHP